jgi:hypothetical protein
VSGCGTVCNFGAAVLPPEKDPEGWPRVYGGVQYDLMVIRNHPAPETTESNGATATWSRSRGTLAVICLVLVGGLTEGVATIVADTLTLPITVPLDMVRQHGDSQKPKEPPAEVSHDEPHQYSVGARGGDRQLPPEPGVP